jgi:hypothetical protein
VNCATYWQKYRREVSWRNCRTTYSCRTWCLLGGAADRCAKCTSDRVRHGMGALKSMPELAGTARAGEIALLRSDLPILLMSGFAGAQLQERARDLGTIDRQSRVRRRC